MNPSETFLKQIDLAAQHQKEHAHDNNGGSGGILSDIKEGVKEVIEKVKGNDSNEIDDDDGTRCTQNCPDKKTQEIVQTFNSDPKLRNETFGASV